MKKWFLTVILCVLSVAALIGAVNAANTLECQQAQAYHDEAMSTNALERRWQLLNESVSLCPQYVNYFERAKTETELQRFEAAQRTLIEIRRYVNGDQQFASVEAQKAEVFLAQSALTRRDTELCAAFHSLEKAMFRLEPSGIPDWLTDLELKFERVKQELQLSAGTIDCLLSQSIGSKRVGVIPKIDLNIQFETGSARLSHSGTQQAAALAEVLGREGYQRYRVIVVGHTDSRGDSDYNQQLSEQRAATVKRYLEKTETNLRGRLRAEGMGESRLKIDPERSESDFHVNRRVEVKLVK